MNNTSTLESFLYKIGGNAQFGKTKIEVNNNITIL